MAVVVFIVCALQGVTLLLWQFREHQHGKAYMELLKLYRAGSLAEYSADGREKAQRSTNFVRPAIERAYSNPSWVEDEDDD